MQILFYILKSKVNKKGLAPLYLRITLGPNDVSEISTGKKVDPKLWDVDKKKVTGRSASADVLNKYIVWAENKVLSIETDLQLKELTYNSQVIKNLFTGEAIKKYSLVQIINIHNTDFESKIGQSGFTEGTLKHYITFKAKIERFIKEKYKRTDLFVSELNYDFIESFHHWLITEGRDDKSSNFKRGLDQETAFGIIGKLKKVAKIAFRRSGIPINPFDDFKCTYSKEGKTPLSMDEVKIIMQKQFSTKRLDKVRDRLIAGCFTGMADSDIGSATRDMITTDLQGNKWIDKGRTKTGELCLIPLWEPVIKIIEKYKEDEDVIAKNALFPQISLQKMNDYLHEIAELCGISKKITTHIARHTFATFYLNSGGTIEGLARILGHSDTRSTRTYAKYDKSSIKKESNIVMNAIFKVEDDDVVRFGSGA